MSGRSYPPRRATCEKCGVSFEASGHGRLPRTCVECKKAVRRAARERWKAANPEGHKLAQRKYYEANRDACRRRIAEWHERNAERRSETLRQWRIANADRRREQQRVWRAANPEAYRTIKRRAVLKAAYGITPEDYDLMLRAQGGVCAICGEAEASDATGKRLAVDHCHATGRVRGLLCANCNQGIGQFKDDAARMRAAADYVERHAET